MLNFQRHNRRFHEHFYQAWLGHGHCDHYCKICADMDSDSRSNVTRDLKFLQLCDSNDIFYTPSLVTTPSVSAHVCSIKCKPTASFTKFPLNIFSVQLFEAKIWHYYHNLTPYSKSLFKVAHVIYNDINRQCYDLLVDKLSPVYSSVTIMNCIMPSLSITQKKLVLAGLLPVSVQSYLSGGYIDCAMGLPKIDYFFPDPSQSEYNQFPNFCLPDFPIE
jgi:hypothetical protein